MPYENHDVDASSCYVMPVVLSERIDRDRVCARMMKRHGVQTSVLYPAVHEFTAYETPGVRLPVAESVARRQLTLPLFPHLEQIQMDLVVRALREALSG